MHVFDGVPVVIADQHMPGDRFGAHLAQRQYEVERGRGGIAALWRARFAEIVVLPNAAIGNETIAVALVSGSEFGAAV